MAFQVSPGISISEKDLTTVVPNTATAIGAYCGGFQWGPVHERTTITTENELVDVFGKPDDLTETTIKEVSKKYSEISRRYLEGPLNPRLKRLAYLIEELKTKK